MRVSFDDMVTEFTRVFVGCGVAPEKAAILARTHAETSRDGVYSHGANRVPRFVKYAKKGWVDVNADPAFVRGFGALAVYDGNFGPGVLNAFYCADRAMDLARDHGIGVVGLRNTSHWQRGGTYGHYAAAKGFIAIMWTNTSPNMPPWGGVDAKIGNNPFVMAAPDTDGPVVLDMAMSLYSYGKLEVTRLKGADLPFPGGYNAAGELTCVPGDIEATKRILPTGYWKGASLSFMLDVIAAIMADGKTTATVGEVDRGDCGGVSQTFIVIDPEKVCAPGRAHEIIATAKDWIKTAASDGTHTIQYPGEGTAKTRAENSEKGILVDEGIWNKIKSL
jgi:3-dehydro-L-gulonate 2-dehydrogenase